MNQARKISPTPPLSKESEELEHTAPKKARPKAPKWSPRTNPAGQTQLEVEFEVVTPMFGGGPYIDPERPHQKKPDPITPVRSAGVRGHLRFWWRETCGYKLGTAAMKEREAEIWGAASTPGKVSLQVLQQPTVTEFQPSPDKRKAENIKRNLSYATFPLQPANHLRNDPKAGVAGLLRTLRGPAKLRLEFPTEFRDDVESALDAWLTFGGIGGRTRRGFGALWGEGREEFKDGRFSTFEVARGEDASVALAAGLAKFQNFRQGPGVGRNPGSTSNRPGRSRWPEPEVIRELTRQADPQHRTRLVGVNKFPRAAFGMPIIFHFQSRSDPQDTSLQPKGKERMASPLILRPVRRGNGWVCLGIRLPDRKLPELVLKGSGRGGEYVADPVVTASEARIIDPLNGEVDPIEAFKKFCSQN